jgi:hypothetical protein
MSQPIITALPEAVARQILVDWVELPHVARIDSAFCTYERRRQYLKLAYAEDSVYTVEGSAQYDIGLPWCLSRGVQLDGLCLRGEHVCDDALRDDKVRGMYAEKYGHKFRWIDDIFDGSNVDHKTMTLVQSCPRLSKLWLSCCGPWTIQYLAGTLRHCTKVVELSVQTFGAALPVEAALPSLVCLSVNLCAVSDEVLVAIGANCPQLRTLYAFHPMLSSQSLISDVGVYAVLQGCLLLQTTDVEYAVGVSHEYRVELARRRNFTKLIFPYWRDVDISLARRVLEVSPALLELHCDGRYLAMDDTTLAVCTQHCPLLEAVELHYCTVLTMTGLHPLFRPGNKLRSIHFVGHSDLGNQVVSLIAERCPLLEECCFEELETLSDKAVVELAQGCSLLEKANFTFSNVGDVRVTALATHCLTLRTLDLTDCALVTMQGVSGLAEHSKNLMKLRLPEGFVDLNCAQLFGAGTVVTYANTW